MKNFPPTAVQNSSNRENSSIHSRLPGKIVWNRWSGWILFFAAFLWGQLMEARYILTRIMRYPWQSYRYPGYSTGIPVTGITARIRTVSYTHLRAHETRHDLVCRLLLEKKKKNN